MFIKVKYCLQSSRYLKDLRADIDACGNILRCIKTSREAYSDVFRVVMFGRESEMLELFLLYAFPTLCPIYRNWRREKMGYRNNCPLTNRVVLGEPHALSLSVNPQNEYTSYLAKQNTHNLNTTFTLHHPSQSVTSVRSIPFCHFSLSLGWIKHARRGAASLSTGGAMLWRWLGAQFSLKPPTNGRGAYPQVITTLVQVTGFNTIA